MQMQIPMVVDPAIDLEVAFFAEDALPDDLSHDRVTRGQLLRMFAHHRDDGLPADFD